MGVSGRRAFQAEGKNTEALRQEHACFVQGIARKSARLDQSKGKGRVLGEKDREGMRRGGRSEMVL